MLTRSTDPRPLVHGAITSLTQSASLNILSIRLGTYHPHLYEEVNRSEDLRICFVVWDDDREFGFRVSKYQCKFTPPTADFSRVFDALESAES